MDFEAGIYHVATDSLDACIEAFVTFVLFVVQTSAPSAVDKAQTAAVS